MLGFKFKQAKTWQISPKIQVNYHVHSHEQLKQFNLEKFHDIPPSWSRPKQEHHGHEFFFQNKLDHT